MRTLGSMADEIAAEPGLEEPRRTRTGGDSEDSEDSASRRAARTVPWKRRRTILVVAAIAAAVIVGVLVYVLLQAGKETTDDAQVDADVVQLAPRVAGQVSAVPVVENQRVRKGELLLQLDDRDYQARVAQATAELESARAQAEAADARVAVAEAGARGSLTQAEANLRGTNRAVAAADAQVKQARASLESRTADLALAESNLGRARELDRGQVIPRQQLDQVEAAANSAKAGERAARAALAQAEENLRRAVAQVAESQGRVVASRPVEANIAAARAEATYQRSRVKSAEAALALARLNLEWTRLVAPDDGTVSGITAHPAAFVGVGQTVGQFVPDRKYVTANFKETQLARMRPGQRVDVAVDTFGRTIGGKVESVSGGTGARFSLVPPENATGNYVKVAQRIPVRVALDELPADMPLRAGQSVEVTVHVSR
jgi:membrane fusion protein (multidrug efflux system)